jgi:tetratricopeptide (TPR) repeat protein
MTRDTRLAQTAFQAGQAAFMGGDYAAAGGHFARALQADPDHAEAHQWAAGVAVREGRLRDAAELLETACRLSPENVQFHADAAMTHSRLGDADAALRHAEKTVSLAPRSLPAHQLLAGIRLPGPQYLEVMAMIHAQLRPRTYLEIGVNTGLSISLARPETRAIGIDPEPRVAAPLGPRVAIRATTSDEYFAGHDVSGDLGGLPIDLAFIDGMHRFEFALRDFINIEKHCSPQSTILIHDCYPLTRLTAEREPQTGFWSGDIWRLILILKRYRPDLGVNVIATAPTGLGIVRGLDPASTLLSERLQEIVDAYLALDYSVLDADQAGMLALFPNDWERIRALLA